MKRRVLLAWSSGKDSAWALQVLRRAPDVEVVGLLTMFNAAADRVAMHAVRRELVEAQAAAAGLPLWPVFLPWPCSNDAYEAQMRSAMAEAKRQDIRCIAFGDLLLEDVRAYRERQLAGTGIEPQFPLGRTPLDTFALAQEMLVAGLRAVITCVDSAQLDGRFAGRTFDEPLLAELPPGVDPCAERGAFHTFCYAGPMFTRTQSIQLGQHVCRDGFHFVDILPG